MRPEGEADMFRSKRKLGPVLLTILLAWIWVSVGLPYGNDFGQPGYSNNHLFIELFFPKQHTMFY
ncbi:hypothetical protein CHH27_01555 [Labrenzia sp. VG12]|nr:hypothetical protein CHH27_01555 [Labrenzia sp. VG12]